MNGEVQLAANPLRRSRLGNITFLIQEAVAAETLARYQVYSRFSIRRLIFTSRQSAYPIGTRCSNQRRTVLSLPQVSWAS